MQPPGQLFDLGKGSFGVDFHIAVSQIANPSVHTQLLGVMQGEVPESHPLDPAFDDQSAGYDFAHENLAAGACGRP